MGSTIIVEFWTTVGFVWIGAIPVLTPILDDDELELDVEVDDVVEVEVEVEVDEVFELGWICVELVWVETVPVGFW